MLTSEVQIVKSTRLGRVTQAVECLSSKCEVLSSKKKKKKC
jgi:hypothetical protein